MAKVAQRLAREGYIRTVRGIGGGLELNKTAEDISIGEVIQQLEGSVGLLECVSATETICVLQSDCGLRRVLARAEALQMDYPRGIRLSDIVVPGNQLVGLTPLPTRHP